MDAYVKIQQTITLRYVHFIIWVSYLNKKVKNIFLICKSPHQGSRKFPFYNQEIEDQGREKGNKGYMSKVRKLEMD